jgi:hypothetical protein
MEAVADHSDRVAAIVARGRSVRRHHHDDCVVELQWIVRRGEAEEWTALREVTEVRIHVEPAHERGDRVAAVRDGADAGHEQADRTPRRKAPKLRVGEPVDDDDREPWLRPLRSRRGWIPGVGMCLCDLRQRGCAAGDDRENEEEPSDSD